MLNAIDLSGLDLNLLVVFEAVFQARNVGRAARQLHVTSSAVSHGLGRLRELFQDPLFLRTPKGVVPTARANSVAPAIAEILARVRGVIGGAERFDPAASQRRFVIGASDATIAMLLPSLLAALRHEAPQVELGIRNLLPMSGLGELDNGADLLLLPLDDIPKRFFAKGLHKEDFVIAARASHPFLKAPTLARYCDARHVLVSMTGETHGYIDEELAKQGLSRRVALSVPNFMLALSALAVTDLLGAIPRSLLPLHAARFGLGSVDAPLPLRRWQIRAIAPEVALADAGISWLIGAVERAVEAAQSAAPEAALKRRRKRRVASDDALRPSRRRATT